MGWRAYRTREPSPYWPLTGKAHTTCKAVAVAVALAVALAAGVGMSRAESVASSAVEIEGSAGIVKQLCAKSQQNAGQLGLSTFAPRHQSYRVAADDGETRRLRGKEERPWPSWGKFVDRLSAAAAGRFTTV